MTPPKPHDVPASRRRAQRVFTLGLLAVVTLARAQTPPRAPTDRGKPADDQEIIRLSEFNVSADTQAGYLASETMTGSRLPTKIKDLPYNIGVITSEFLNDFAIIDNSEIFEGGVITQDQDAGSGYSLRGISNTGQLYNGFWQPAGTPVPNALKDRVEILNGPSAGAYGQTAPGGIINIVSKQPKRTPQQTLRYTFGSYDQQDASFESTGPLGAKTSYLLLLNYNERGFSQPWHHDRSRTAALTLQHRIDPTSNVRVELVASSQRNHSPANRVPYLFSSLLQRVDGVAYELMDRSGTGPNSYRNVDNYSVFGTYEKRLNPTLSVRLGANYYAAHTRRFNDVDTSAYDPDPTHARADPYSSTFFGLARFRDTSSAYTAPYIGKNYKDGGGVQGDILARYWLFNRAVENRTLLTFDCASIYNYIDRCGFPARVTLNPDGSPRVNANGSLPVSNGIDATVVPPAPRFAGDTAYWVPVINPLGPQIIANPATGLAMDIYNLPNASSSQYTPFTWQRNRTNAFGTMLRHQATIRNGLLFFGAVRFDYVTYNNHAISYPRWSVAWHPEWARYYDASFAALNTSPPVTRYSASAWTPSIGSNFRATPWLSTYANYSTSFKISTQVISGSTRGSYVLPNERAKGFDYGFKGSVFEERLNWTAGGFYILQENMSVNVDDGFGGRIREAEGTVTSKGAVITGSFVVNEKWAFSGGYYFTNARWGKTGVDLDLAGRRKAIVPPEIVTATANYSFGGPLKGLRAFAMYQYAGKTRADDGGALATAGTVYILPGSNNRLREVKLPAYSTVNVGLAYRFQTRTFEKALRQQLQFNVGNLFDKEYVTYSRGVGDSRSYKVTYQVSF